MTRTATHTHGWGMRITAIVLGIQLAAMTTMYLLTAAKLSDGAAQVDAGAAQASDGSQDLADGAVSLADGAADPAVDVAVPPDCGGAVLCVVVSELVGVAAPFDAVHPVRARADVIPRVMAQLRAVLCVMAPVWIRAMLFAIVNNKV